MAVEQKAPARAKSVFEQLVDAVEPDKHQLDDAWQHQPDLFWRASDGLSKAVRERDLHKLDLEALVAKLDYDLREAASKAERKVTEPSIAREIELDDEVAQAKRALVDLNNQVQRWEGLKESYRQRGFCLTGLTDLHLANYYQTNSGGASKAADSIRQAAGEERRSRK